MRRVLALFLCALLLGAAPTTAQVEMSTSDVTGVTRIASTDMRAVVADAYPGQARYRAVYTNDPDGGATWSLVFYGFAEDTTDMGRATQVRVRADGQTIQPAQVTSDARSMNGTLLEIKRTAFPRSAYQRIATAQNVRVLIGPARFRITRPLRSDMRRILDRVPPGGRPPTASSDSAGGR